LGQQEEGQMLYPEEFIERVVKEYATDPEVEVRLRHMLYMGNVDEIEAYLKFGTLPFNMQVTPFGLAMLTATGQLEAFHKAAMDQLYCRIGLYEEFKEFMKLPA
jgi:hypothetical protein